MCVHLDLNETELETIVRANNNTAECSPVESSICKLQIVITKLTRYRTSLASEQDETLRIDLGIGKSQRLEKQYPNDHLCFIMMKQYLPIEFIQEKDDSRFK